MWVCGQSYSPLLFFSLYFLGPCVCVVRLLRGQLLPAGEEKRVFSLGIRPLSALEKRPFATCKMSNRRRANGGERSALDSDRVFLGIESSKMVSTEASLLFLPSSRLHTQSLLFFPVKLWGFRSKGRKCVPEDGEKREANFQPKFFSTFFLLRPCKASHNEKKLFLAFPPPYFKDEGFRKLFQKPCFNGASTARQVFTRSLSFQG